MGIYQKIKDWYTGSNELEDPAKRETLGTLLTGLEMLVVGGGVLGLASKVEAGQRRYMNEYYDKGEPISEIKGAREKTLKGGYKSKVNWIVSFQDQNQFLSFYHDNSDVGSKLQKIVKSQIDVDINQFEEFINIYKDSEKFNVAFFAEEFMYLGIKTKGKRRKVIIPLKDGSYQMIRKFQKKHFR